MEFFKTLFKDTRVYFGNKFLIFFSLIFTSALLDFFAIISFFPILEILFPGDIVKNEKFSQLIEKYTSFIGINNNTALLLIILIIIFSATRLVEYSSNFFTVKFSQNVKLKLKKEFIEKLNNCYLTYFINVRSGEIINLYNREIGFAVEVYRLFFMGLSRIIIFIILLPFLLYNEFFLTTITALSIILIVLLLKKFYKVVHNVGGKVVEYQKKVSSSFSFFVNNIFNISKSSYQKQNSEIINNETKKLTTYELKQINYGLLTSSFIEPLFIFFLIFVFYIFIKLNNNLPAEYIINIAFLLRFARHFLSIQNFYLKIINWERYIISKKFHDNLLVEYSSKESSKNKRLEKILSLNIKNLNIEFNNKKILNNFNLELKKPFFVKINGKNGSGKTSIVRALLGLIQTNNGSIKYNDINLKEIDKNSLSKKVIILDKNPLIIKGSIFDNITLGFTDQSVDEKELLELISRFNLNSIFHEFNLKTKNIEEEGKNLSQGQMQKISFIRAILNKYELIIIDEGISNIDEKDERKILEYLKECYNSGETNIIFVSHKSTYDQIFKQTVNLDNHDKN